MPTRLVSWPVLYWTTGAVAFCGVGYFLAPGRVGTAVFGLALMVAMVLNFRAFPGTTVGRLLRKTRGERAEVIERCLWLEMEDDASLTFLSMQGVWSASVALAILCFCAIPWRPSFWVWLVFYCWGLGGICFAAVFHLDRFLVRRLGCRNDRLLAALRKSAERVFPAVMEYRETRKKKEEREACESEQQRMKEWQDLVARMGEEGEDPSVCPLCGGKRRMTDGASGLGTRGYACFNPKCVDSIDR